MSWTLLIKPAKSITGRMSYLQKFLVVFFVFALPIAVLLVTLFEGLVAQNRFLAQERSGVAYIKVIRPLLQHMPQHRGMTNAYLNGNDSFKGKILDKRVEVDGFLSALKKVDQELGEELRTSSMVGSIQQQWQGIKDNSMSGKAPEVFAEHSEMIGKVIDLVVHVADSSNLILDPELDSYYLMDGMVNRLPKLTDAMGKTRGLASGNAAKGDSINQKDAVKLSVLMYQVQQGIQELHHALKTVSSVNPDAGAKLKQMDATAVEKAQEFFDFINSEMLNKDTFKVDASEVFEVGTQAIAASFGLFDQILPTLDELLQNRLEAGKSTVNLMIIAVVGSLLLVVWLFSGMYSTVIDSISTINESAKRMAEGDLSTRIKLNVTDEMKHIADSFNKMVDEFSHTVNEIITASTQVASSSSQLSHTAEQTNTNIQVQQGETHQAAIAMAEMSSTVREVAANIAITSTAANDANDETSNGKQVVNEVVTGIQQLADQVDSAADLVTVLEQDSENINTVLDVIMSIAEQTNLLALNAAIEAARAGEQGRGFAVVADEVRTLAGRTQESTSEINHIIEKLQSGSRTAVEAMGRSREQARSVADQASLAGSSLQTIAESVSSIDEMSSNIATSAEEQNAVADNMNSNIDHINEMASQNAEAAKQTCQTGRELAEMASHLSGLVQRFRIKPGYS